MMTFTDLSSAISKFCAALARVAENAIEDREFYDIIKKSSSYQHLKRRFYEIDDFNILSYAPSFIVDGLANSLQHAVWKDDQFVNDFIVLMNKYVTSMLRVETNIYKILLSTDVTRQKKIEEELKYIKEVLFTSWFDKLARFLNIFAKRSREYKEEAPSTAKLGRFAFPSSRTVIPLEPDTAYEKELFRHISSHFQSEGLFSDEDIRSIIEFIDMGYYTDIFKELKTGTVYRGMSVATDFLKTNLKKEFSLLSQKNSADVRLHVRPKHAYSSWTTDRSIAEKFTREPADNIKREWGVLLETVVEENHEARFISCEGFYKLDAIKPYSDEEEIIVVGPVVSSKISWTKTDEISKEFDKN